SHSRRLFMRHRSWLRAYSLALSLSGSCILVLERLVLFLLPLFLLRFLGGGSSFSNSKSSLLRSVLPRRKSKVFLLNSESGSFRASVDMEERKSSREGKAACNRRKSLLVEVERCGSKSYMVFRRPTQWRI